MDFAKAFDKVDFSVVLGKMKNLGINGKLYKWIECFLLNRHQSVIVDGHLSKKSPVLSGVPQGSVLGPLIFLLLIGDIDANVRYARVTSFADDTRAAKGVSNVREISQLQSDLDEIYS